jgi:hypothetical protein
MNIEQTINTIYSRKPVRILLHIGFWTALLCISRYLTGISFNNYKHFPEPLVSLLTVTGIIRIMLFYYPFVYWVLPRFFNKRRWMAGVLITCVLVIFYAFTDALTEELLMKPCSACMAIIKDANNGYGPFLQMNLLNRWFLKVISLGVLIGTLFNIALPLSIKLGMQALRHQFRSMQLAKENLQLEFNFLRSQVNPHFLFNTLNNIYGLILKDEKEKSAGMVARLSQFLRYSLYESNSEQVPVEKEIQLLKDYVALESVRLNLTKVQFTPTSDDSVKLMPPLLFMPVVENSFKYAADEPDAHITIDLRIMDKKIYFTAQNTVDLQRQATDAGGIGLNNFKKRLELYYAGQYRYEVKNDSKIWSVSIKIDCHE